MTDNNLNTEIFTVFGNDYVIIDGVWHSYDSKSGKSFLSVEDSK